MSTLDKISAPSLDFVNKATFDREKQEDIYPGDVGYQAQPLSKSKKVEDDFDYQAKHQLQQENHNRTQSKFNLDLTDEFDITDKLKNHLAEAQNRTKPE